MLFGIIPIINSEDPVMTGDSLECLINVLSLGRKAVKIIRAMERMSALFIHPNIIPKLRSIHPRNVIFMRCFINRPRFVINRIITRNIKANDISFRLLSDSSHSGIKDNESGDDFNSFFIWAVSTG